MFKKMLAIAVCVFMASGAWAWPERTVKIIVPLAPGGGNDIIARMVGQELSNIWKQPVVVENRPGGQATLGAAYVAKSDADGYTLLSAQPNILASSSVLVEDVQYNWEKDLTAVGFIGAAPPFVLAVSARTGVKNLAELREYARSRGVTYSSAGAGGPFHVYGALFTQGLGIKGIHVPYKAAPPAVVDVVSGTVDMIFAPPAQVQQHIKAGTLVPLAVVGDRAYDKMPEVPPMSRLGVKDFPNLHTNYAIFAPAGISDSVRQKLTADIARAYEIVLPELLTRNLVDPNTPAPRNFTRQAQEDGRTWVRLTHKVKE